LGHYCKICGRTRANEKFSGKGHKNHVCKDCSGKSGIKAKKDNENENDFDLETIMPLKTVPIQWESMYYDDHRFPEIDFENENADDDKDEELPF
jgi:ribosome-binding protein aMBF1 (putative translation factor)